MIKFKIKYIPIPHDYEHVGEAKVQWAKRAQSVFNRLIRDGWDIAYETDAHGMLITARKNTSTIDEMLMQHLIAAGLVHTAVGGPGLDNVAGNQAPKKELELRPSDRGLITTLLRRLEAGPMAGSIAKQVEKLLPTLINGISAGEMIACFDRIEHYLEWHNKQAHIDGSTCEMTEALTALLRHGREGIRLSVS